MIFSYMGSAFIFIYFNRIDSPLFPQEIRSFVLYVFVFLILSLDEENTFGGKFKVI